MRWPWVSRGRYEDALARITELQGLQNELFDLLGRKDELLAKSAGLTDRAMQVGQTEAPARATIDGVEAWANQWARKRAEERGRIQAQ